MPRAGGQIAVALIPRRKAAAAAALATIFAMTGCAGVLTRSDRAVLGDSLGARIYDLDRYERLCPHDEHRYLAGTPQDCAKMGNLLNEWRHANDVATDVLAKGSMPPQERQELRGYVSAVAKLPKL